MVGFTQESKTPEIVFAAWVSFFVLGCLPVLFVRNGGGRISGSADMRKGVADLNDRIVMHLTEMGVQKFLHDKFCLKVRASCNYLVVFIASECSFVHTKVRAGAII